MSRKTVKILAAAWLAVLGLATLSALAWVCVRECMRDPFGLACYTVPVAVVVLTAGAFAALAPDGPGTLPPPCPPGKPPSGPRP